MSSARSGTPRADGYRWPAEWEPHDATWLSWPHNPDTWPEQLARVEGAFVDMVEALAPHERVEINVNDAAAADRVRRLLGERDRGLPDHVGLHEIRTDDAWVRDHGPLFVLRDGAVHDASTGQDDAPPLAVVDFDFQAWGEKYPPWDHDEAVARTVAASLGLPCYRAGFVLEPGAIDGNGRGTLLTTESCLLNPNRGGGRARDRDLLEARLGDMLAADRVIWLGDGIVGDDTDGHVDDITRFVAPDRVVTAVEPDARDANHVPLAENLERLEALRRSSWPALEIVPLPMPAPLRQAGERLPASHANFYLANGVVLMPSFGGESDARAAAVLAECCPGREVVPIPAADLVVGLGAVHCLTQQQPAARRDPSRSSSSSA